LSYTLSPPPISIALISLHSVTSNFVLEMANVYNAYHPDAAVPANILEGLSGVFVHRYKDFEDLCQTVNKVGHSYRRGEMHQTVLGV
jgi:hypothetical protein